MLFQVIGQGQGHCCVVPDRGGRPGGPGLARVRDLNLGHGRAIQGGGARSDVPAGAAQRDGQGVPGIADPLELVLLGLDEDPSGDRPLLVEQGSAADGAAHLTVLSVQFQGVLLHGKPGDAAPGGFSACVGQPCHCQPERLRHCHRRLFRAGRCQSGELAERAKRAPVGRDDTRGQRTQRRDVRGRLVQQRQRGGGAFVSERGGFTGQSLPGLRSGSTRCLALLQPRLDALEPVRELFDAQHTGQSVVQLARVALEQPAKLVVGQKRAELLQRAGPAERVHPVLLLLAGALDLRRARLDVARP